MEEVVLADGPPCNQEIGCFRGGKGPDRRCAGGNTYSSWLVVFFPKGGSTDSITRTYRRRCERPRRRAKEGVGGRQWRQRRNTTNREPAVVEAERGGDGQRILQTASPHFPPPDPLASLAYRGGYEAHAAPRTHEIHPHTPATERRERHSASAHLTKEEVRLGSCRAPHWGDVVNKEQSLVVLPFDSLFMAFL